MATGGSPTVWRRRLGTELRRLRELAGISAEQAAWHLECSLAKISRLETGRVSTRPVDVQALLALFEVAETEREALIELARGSPQRGWWRAYGSASPIWFQEYIGLESEASLLSTFETQFVPGLLQTAEYSRALFTAGHPDSGPEGVEAQVKLRLARQSLLDRDDGPRLWAVIDESALCRPIGGAAAMRAQLRHLVEVAERPTVTVQVLPFRAGPHVAMDGAFMILEFHDDPGLVYLETLTGAMYLERPGEVAAYALAFDQLRVAALSPCDSAALIAEFSAGYDGDGPAQQPPQPA